MSDEILRCWECNFKLVKSQLGKTFGYCPKCARAGVATLLSKSLNIDTGGQLPALAITRAKKDK